jgi:hypothetical protein
MFAKKTRNYHIALQDSSELGCRGDPPRRALLVTSRAPTAAPSNSTRSSTLFEDGLPFVSLLACGGFFSRVWEHP